jgi:hypothetical protein
VTITVTDFGGQAPNSAAEKVGEVFTYKWSLYRDRLTFATVPGKVSPSGWTIAPLRRVAG